MKVILAGYNLDTETIKELIQRKEVPAATPETISASYARISRDPKPVDELRRIARKEVEKARKSNKKIIFGMGHHSIAEHAVFNFDLIDISRLAIEEVEKFRLCSYTEKSQRYQKLEDNFLIPSEIKGTQFEPAFVDTIKLQNKFYQELAKEVEEEDARYITSLATLGQLGETINARNLELLFRRFASHPLFEVRNLGLAMFREVEKITPSIILFTEANDYDQKTYPELKELVYKLIGREKVKKDTTPVKLVDYTGDADDKIIATLLHTSSSLPYEEAFRKTKKMALSQKKEITKTACAHMELYDAALREFEYVSLTYNLVISASCFAQLKRHRMASLTYQSYNPELGYTIPPSIKEAGLDGKFLSVMEKTNEVYWKIAKEFPRVAQYILTNAHRRRVLLRVNARELYHISRLREDAAAQWDIREITKIMVDQAKKVMPLTLLLTSGKDRYPKLYEEIFGRPPKVIEATLPT